MPAALQAHEGVKRRDEHAGPIALGHKAVAGIQPGVGQAPHPRPQQHRLHRAVLTPELAGGDPTPALRQSRTPVVAEHAGGVGDGKQLLTYPHRSLEPRLGAAEQLHVHRAQHLERPWSGIDASRTCLIVKLPFDVGDGAAGRLGAELAAGDGHRRVIGAPRRRACALDAAVAADPQAQSDLCLLLPAPGDEVDQEGKVPVVELEEPVFERSPAALEVIHRLP